MTRVAPVDFSSIVSERLRVCSLKKTRSLSPRRHAARDLFQDEDSNVTEWNTVILAVYFVQSLEQWCSLIKGRIRIGYYQ